MRTRYFAAIALASLAALGAQACGGDDSPMGPTNPGGGGGGGGQSAATITIASGGVTPASVTVPAGSRVTFVNNDSRSHQMSSNPHPVHTDCPAINLANLGSGGQAQTGVLNATGTCGFHDHNFPDDGTLQGTIVVQ